MISALLFAAVAACSNPSSRGDVILQFKGNPPAVNLDLPTRMRITRSAYYKAEELGYKLNQLLFELYEQSDSFIVFFRPMITEDGRKPSGGGLTIVINRDGRVECYFQGQ
jgi:hypothetical protein